MSHKNYFVFVEPIGPNRDLRTTIPIEDQSIEDTADGGSTFSRKAGSQLYLGANYVEMRDIDFLEEDNLNSSLFSYSSPPTEE